MKRTVDQAAARELELYAENTRRIYDAYTVPTIRSLTRICVLKLMFYFLTERGL